MRLLTQTLRDAIDLKDSYTLEVRADFYPSRIFFDTITEDHPIDIADAAGMVEDPVPQDVEYSPVDDCLVTFYIDGSTLKYAKQGSATGTSLSITSSVKPGVLGSKLYAYTASGIERRSINWSGISTSVDATIAVSNVLAVHAVSDTECVALTSGSGGFRPLYISGSTVYTCPYRFMFPTFVLSSGSGRTMQEQALFSGAAALGDKIFIYISNAQSGMVEGLYYDKETDCWSDIYTVLPTDLQVSQCEFWISNVYTHNEMLYMCGQFYRTDNLSGGQPYSLLLYSVDGRTFSIERNTLVSNLGYRFLARPGADRLYLGNCNRVCYDTMRWVFDGTSGSGRMTSIPATAVKGFSDQDNSQCTLTVAAGNEQYFDHNDIVEGARMLVYCGMDTTAGKEWVLYGTYIVQPVNYGLSAGKRDISIQGVQEAQWKLSGLNMPFYIEILGKSLVFDPLAKDAVLLDYASGSYRTETQFSADFWYHQPYTSGSIAGIDMHESGGVNYYEATGAHSLGIIHDRELKEILNLADNPKITASSLTVNAYGWSHPESGGVNDTISLLLVTVNENNAETTHVGTASPSNWSSAYPTAISGAYPIVFTIGGLTAGHRIKKAAIVFEASVTTWFNIGRLDFINNVEAHFLHTDPETSWTNLQNGSLKVPRVGRPYIMYAANPLDARVFSLAASFSNTTQWAIAGYPTADGLVGLSADGANYICGRYNKTNNKVELVKCRDGIESVLASATPGFTINTSHQVRFDYKGGRFEILMCNTDVSAFESCLVYEWQDTDGYLFTDSTKTAKCGVYGCIMAPSVRTLGYYAGDSDDLSCADGIAIEPLGSLTGFPTSGSLHIGDDTYVYTGLIDQPTVPRGPYQFRQKDKYEADAGGDGDYGLECRDFNYGASTALLTGKLVAVSSGANFINTDALWDVWVTTGGVPVHLYNRARFNSANTAIGKTYHTLGDKVWVTGGFSGVTQVGSQSARIGHAEGEIATYIIPGDIVCFWYMGAGGSDDSTVGDMIDKVCNLAGVAHSYPGSYTSGSLALSGEQELIAIPYAEGMDLHFDIEQIANFQIRCSVKIKSDNYENTAAFRDDTDLRIAVTYAAEGRYTYTITSQPSGTILYRCLFISTSGPQTFRVTILGDAIGLYQNGQWVTTVVFDELVYGDSLSIKMYGTVELSNIQVHDFSDWREAIWIDMETDGRSALGSIIQQRPVETVPRADGSLALWYEVTRQVITGVREPRQHTYIHQMPVDGGSDAIVYGAKNVKTIQNAQFAKKVGLSSRLMRMPDLDIGSLRASYLILKKAFESYRMHDIITRPDLACEIGDIYHLSYTASGTQRVEDHLVIIETCSLEVNASGMKVGSRMVIRGREVYYE